MIDGSAAIGWRAMLADVLDAPVAELSVCNYIDVTQNFLDARSLRGCQCYYVNIGQGVGDAEPCLPRDNSQIYFGQQGSRSRLERLRATYHGVLRSHIS